MGLIPRRTDSTNTQQHSRRQRIGIKAESKHYQRTLLYNDWGRSAAAIVSLLRVRTEYHLDGMENYCCDVCIIFIDGDVARIPPHTSIVLFSKIVCSRFYIYFDVKTYSDKQTRNPKPCEAYQNGHSHDDCRLAGAVLPAVKTVFSAEYYCTSTQFLPTKKQGFQLGGDVEKKPGSTTSLLHSKRVH